MRLPWKALGSKLVTWIAAKVVPLVQEEVEETVRREVDKQLGQTKRSP
jgi:hypothetical protein